MDAPVHQNPPRSLKALAIGALQGQAPVSTGASGADGARGATGAEQTRQRLRGLAATLGIPREIVDRLALSDLEATAEQLVACEGHLDADGNPLAHSLLVFYLRALADPATTTKSTR
jgi:hypothetical protein